MIPSKPDRASISSIIRASLALGLLVSCLLITAIGLLSWHTTHTLEEKIEKLIEHAEVGTSLIYDMRIAARERNLHLMLSILLDDPFVRDEQWLKFLEQGSLFLNAREAYIAMGVGEKERQVLAEQREISKVAVALQYELYDYVQNNNKQKAIEVLTEELTYQVRVFNIIDSLLELHKASTQEKIAELRNYQADTAKIVAFLSFFVIMVIIIMTLVIINRISQQAEYLEDEATKFKALIEGSMDAVVVIDDKKIIDCNKNALDMFCVGTFDELGRIGLDFISWFSDKGHAIESKQVLNAVNPDATKSKRRYEWNFNNPNGKIIPTDVELTGVELKGEDYVQMIVRDITERRAFENQLQTANENLELKVEERTRELEELNSKVAGIARSAGMAEVASGVLHNVGNVLNSVNVSASILKDQVRNTKSLNLEKLALLMEDNKHDLTRFMEDDEKGKFILPYLHGLAKQLKKDQAKQAAELDSLSENIEHIKNIITMQQSYTGGMGVIERVKASSITEDAIKINMSSMKKHHIEVTRDYQDDPEISIDKHKLMQILVNFISNAKYAVEASKKDDKQVVIGIKKEGKRVVFFVQDNGIGIDHSDIGRIFEFGFKKRAGGHGFGMHHSALSAKELDGDIAVYSDGLGQGARFEVELPVTAE